MNLPNARNTDYVPGATPVKGADLNDIQDKIIELHARVGGDREIWMDAAMMTSAGSPAALSIDDTTGVVKWTFALGNRVACAVPGLRRGDKIKAFTLRADTTAGGTPTLDIKLWRRTSTAAPTQIGITGSPSGTTTDATFVLATPEPVDAGDDFLITVRHAAGAGAPILYAVAVIVERTTA